MLRSILAETSYSMEPRSSLLAPEHAPLLATVYMSQLQGRRFMGSPLPLSESLRDRMAARRWR